MPVPDEILRGQISSRSAERLWRYCEFSIKCCRPSHHLSVHGDTVYNFIISSLIQHKVTANMLTESNGSLLKSHLQLACTPRDQLRTQRSVTTWENCIFLFTTTMQSILHWPSSPSFISEICKFHRERHKRR